jgi:hypothetical protein
VGSMAARTTNASSLPVAFRASLGTAGPAIRRLGTTAALWGNDSAHPTFSLLVDPILDTYPGRLLGWFGWLATGRWLVTR